MSKAVDPHTSEFEIPCSIFCGSAKRILLIGYGNPGRLDDGLGPALAEKFQQAEPAPNSFQTLEQSVPTETLNVQALGEVSKPSCNDFQALELSNLTVESNYQLNVEDAAQIAEHDIVVFADASTDAEPPFTFTPVASEPGGLSFSSHSVSAPQLLGMVSELFHKQPEAWMLAIRGTEFNEFGEVLSEPAKQNLAAAVEFLTEWIKEKNYG